MYHLWIYHNLLNSVFNMFLALFHNMCCSSSFFLELLTPFTSDLYDRHTLSYTNHSFLHHTNCKYVWHGFLHQTCTAKISGVQNSCNLLNLYEPQLHQTDHWSYFPCNCHRYKKLFLEPLCCSLTQFTRAWIITMFEYSRVVLVPFFCLVLVFEYQGSGTFPCLMRYIK